MTTQFKPVPLRMRNITKSCTSKCDVCGGHKGPHKSHAKCSKIRQARMVGK